MANWQDPRPLFPWSAPPEQQSTRIAPKIKPNIYARLARFSVQHPVAILLLFIFLLATAATIVLLSLRVDFRDSGVEEAAQGEVQSGRELAIRFSNAQKVVQLRLGADDPQNLVPAARELATLLAQKTETVKSVLLPELQAADQRFAPYYLDTPELNRRVADVRAAQAYLQLLSTSPTLGGLNGMLASTKAAADAGTQPASLAPLLEAMSGAVNNLVAGRAASINWAEATGMAAPPNLAEVTLLVFAQENRAETAAQVSDDLAAFLQANPFLRAEIERPQTDAVAAESSTGREFIVAVFLALLFLVSALAVSLRSARDVSLSILPVILGVMAGTASSTFMMSPLDTLGATLPMMLVPGALAASLCYVFALMRHEKRAISTMSLIMLAAQQSGAAVLAMLAVSAVIWLAWILLAPVSSATLAVATMVGHGVAVVATLLALPTFAALVPRQKADFVPAAAGHAARHGSLAMAALAARPWMALALLAAAIVSAAVLLFHVSLASPGAAGRPLHIQAPTFKAASDAVAALRAEESVGRIVWIEDFLPADVEAKQQSLALLSSMALPEKQAAETPAALVPEQFASLDATLQALAATGQAGQRLQSAAVKLRRNLALLANATAGTGDAGKRFEQMLASSLLGLKPTLANLANLPPPSPGDLDPSLRALYLAEDGAHRVEVWPRPPVNERQFTAAVRAVDKDAVFAEPSAGEAGSGKGWRFLTAIMVACIALFGLSMLVLASVAAAVELLLLQLCGLLLTAALATILGIGPPSLVEAALFAGLGVCAMTSLWVKFGAINAWVTPHSYLILPLSGAAVVLPLILLSLPELAGFARTMFIFMAVVAVLHAVLEPQARALISKLSYPSFARGEDESQSARDKPGKQQVSTNPGGNVTTGT